MFKLAQPVDNIAYLRRVSSVFDKAISLKMSK